MKHVKFRVISGTKLLAECDDINVAAACFEGILAKFGDVDNFNISLDKITFETKEDKEVKKTTKKEDKKVNDKKEQVCQNDCKDSKELN